MRIERNSPQRIPLLSLQNGAIPSPSIEWGHQLSDQYAIAGLSVPRERATSRAEREERPERDPHLAGGLPWRASRTMLGTITTTIAMIIATGTQRPSAAPISRASFTSPIPIPLG